MRALLILAALVLAACQTRAANPVRLSQPHDRNLDCRSIATIQTANRREAARLAKLDEGVAIGNAIAVTISKTALFFWPAVMGVDLSDAEEIEVRALRDRNIRLAEIGRNNGCAETAETAEAPPAKRQ